MPPLVLGFISPADCAIIFVLALIIFGPKKLPEVGKQLGQAMREFRKISDELTGHVTAVRDEVESAYKPILSENRYHPTVEPALKPRAYDQEPEHPMAPAAELAGSDELNFHASGLTLSTVPTETEKPLDGMDTKGHGS